MHKCHFDRTLTQFGTRYDLRKIPDYNPSFHHSCLLLVYSHGRQKLEKVSIFIIGVLMIWITYYTLENLALIPIVFFTVYNTLYILLVIEPFPKMTTLIPTEHIHLPLSPRKKLAYLTMRYLYRNQRLHDILHQE